MWPISRRLSQVHTGAREQSQELPLVKGPIQSKAFPLYFGVNLFALWALWRTWEKKSCWRLTRSFWKLWKRRSSAQCASWCRRQNPCPRARMVTSPAPLACTWWGVREGRTAPPAGSTWARARASWPGSSWKMWIMSAALMVALSRLQTISVLSRIFSSYFRCLSTHLESTSNSVCSDLSSAPEATSFATRWCLSARYGSN